MVRIVRELGRLSQFEMEEPDQRQRRQDEGSSEDDGEMDVGRETRGGLEEDVEVSGEHAEERSVNVEVDSEGPFFGGLEGVDRAIIGKKSGEFEQARVSEGGGGRARIGGEHS